MSGQGSLRERPGSIVAPEVWEKMSGKSPAWIGFVRWMRGRLLVWRASLGNPGGRDWRERSLGQG